MIQETKKYPNGLSYDDVLLKPQYSDIRSRSEIDISSALGDKLKLKLPIIASPMDTVSETDMAIVTSRLGGTAIIHRYNTIPEQINLMKNAVESIQSMGAAGEINLSWQVTDNKFSLTISDEGIGISNNDNLFVPFYTTKKQGSGIGLVFCRQILEVHNGQLNLVNREDRSGCLAIIELALG